MPQPRKDAVHRYFTYDDGISQCQLCEKNIKGKHTSNLKNHLAVKHTTEFQNVLEINKANPKSNKGKSKENDSVIDNIKEICMQLVTVHGRPLAMVNDNAFQRLINLAAPSDPNTSQINEKAIRSIIIEKAYLIKNKIWEEIKNKMLSLKLDSVTCLERKFVGINIQYIKNSQVIVRNLAVLEVQQSQTGAFLKEILEEVLAEFKISTDQIYCVCTDNGANMIKMVKLIGGKYYIDEYISEEEEHEEEHEVEEREENEQIDITLEHIADINSNDELIFTEDFDINNCISNTDFKIRGMLCAAHTLQLAIKDAINEDVSAHATINLARKIVIILRKPNNINKLKAAKLKKPIIDCPTRWTSTYNMLRRLITFRDISDTILELFTLISPRFWVELTALVESMEPVNKTTIKLQQNSLTIGDFYIAWINCKNSLKDIDSSFAKSLVKAMEVRESKLLKNDVVLESLYLDRRLNLILNNQQCEKAKSLIKETYNQLIKLQNVQRNINFNDTEEINDALPMPSTSRSSAPTNISSLALEEILVRAETSRGSFRQISSFDASLNELIGCPRIPLNENIIKAWNNESVKCSELAKVANIILAAPATQVSVERLFSSLKFILNPLRSNLNKFFLKDLMLVRENKDLLG